MTEGQTALENSANERESVAAEMLEFVQSVPASMGNEHLKEYQFLLYFEAERLCRMRTMLLKKGFRQTDEFRVLDFGYLHGLVPEFLHRFFPKARFLIYDHPDSPIFKNEEYLQLIRRRDYITYSALHLANLSSIEDKFDLVILGEIIEHLDPTLVASVLKNLKCCISNEGCLLITTPNAISVKGVFYSLFGRDAEHPPIPDSTMGYGHIHLWTHTLLSKTMDYYGWQNRSVDYFHGFDERERLLADKQWGSLRWQILIRSLFLLATQVPRWRSSMLSLWQLKTKN